MFCVFEFNYRSCLGHVVTAFWDNKLIIYRGLFIIYDSMLHVLPFPQFIICVFFTVCPFFLSHSCSVSGGTYK